MTFRCRNEQMQGRCVYIVMGTPVIERCDVQGSVLICGIRTAPQLVDCNIRGSRGSGLHLTDHCRASLRGCSITQNRRHGVLVDRLSCPTIMRNKISSNSECGIRVFHGKLSNEQMSGVRSAVDGIHDNLIEGNGGDSISFSPQYVDSEENIVDADVGSDDD